MSRNKPDSTSKEICAALRKAGAHVTQIASAARQAGVPDLLIAWRGEFLVAELKTSKGKLSDAQVIWHAQAAPAKVHVLRSVDDAMKMLSLGGPGLNP